MVDDEAVIEHERSDAIECELRYVTRGLRGEGHAACLPLALLRRLGALCKFDFALFPLRGFQYSLVLVCFGRFLHQFVVELRILCVSAQAHLLFNLLEDKLHGIENPLRLLACLGKLHILDALFDESVLRRGMTEGS